MQVFLSNCDPSESGTNGGKMMAVRCIDREKQKDKSQPQMKRGH